MFSNLQSDKEGQTLPDFALAFGIFIIGIGVAFGATSSLFQQYNTNQDYISEGDRIANQLISNTLIEEDGTRYMLSQECTVTVFQAFNEESVQADEKCGYNSSIENQTVNEYFGHGDEGGGINFSIVDAENNIVTHNGQELETGNSIPDIANTTTSIRLIEFSGEVYELRVVVW